MIMVLFGLIVASGVLRVILALVSIGSGHYTPPKPQQDVHVDVHVKQVPPPPQNPTIAEQFDGRLTNIVRNPLEGIL